MSFIPVVQYGIGLGVFGFVYWLLNGIMVLIVGHNVHEASAAFTILQLLWVFSVLIYIIFGGWWLIRSYDEREYQQFR